MTIGFEAIFAASALAQALNGTPLMRPSDVIAPQYSGVPPAAADEVIAVLIVSPIASRSEQVMAR